MKTAHCLGFGLVLLWLPTPAGAREPPRLVERFEVGAEVYVRALAPDPGRNMLWVGTSVGALGVDLASRQVVHSFTREHGLANEYVFAIGVAPDGAVWFGTNAGGVSRWRDGAWKTWFPMHGLADYWVYAFAWESPDRLWIGTWDGASLYDRKTDSFVNFREELVNIWVYGLDIDREGRVWFGTEGGVSMFDGDTWHAWTHEDGLGAPDREGRPASDNTGLGTRSRHDLTVTAGSGETYNPSYVFATLVDDRDGSVWFGTWGGGASRLRSDGTFENLTTADGLAGDIVYAIAQEPDGTLWFGTNRGLSRLDGERFTNWRTADGLLGPDVYAIAVDPAGDVWAGTKGGVARLVYGGAGGGDR